MEEYNLESNIGKFTLLIGKERIFYNTEGISQMIDLQWDNLTIYNSNFGRYDLLDKIINDNHIELLDFWVELPTVVIIKDTKEITISKNGYDYQQLDGEYYDQFMDWLIYGLKTIDMKRKEKIELIKGKI